MVDVDDGSYSVQDRELKTIIGIEVDMVKSLIKV